MPLGISITATGPLFGTSGGTVAVPSVFALDGAQPEFERAINQTVEELARQGMVALFQQGQSKPGGVFLSVEEAKAHHSKPSTGNWRAHLHVTVGFLHAEIVQPVEYGAWIEGEDSRNTSTRFRGYHQFRKMRDKLEQDAPAVAERFVNEAVTRLNG